MDFEQTVRELATPLSIPARALLDLRRFVRFARWMAIGEVRRHAPAFNMRLAGSGFADIFGFDLTNSNYLDLLEPSVRDGAYESACALADKPCGLWQMTPVKTEDGRRLSLEYTLLPFFDERTSTADLLVFAWPHTDDETSYPRALQIGGSTEWHWIDVGFGVPASSPAPK